MLLIGGPLAVFFSYPSLDQTLKIQYCFIWINLWINIPHDTDNDLKATRKDTCRTNYFLSEFFKMIGCFVFIWVPALQIGADLDQLYKKPCSNSQISWNWIWLICRLPWIPNYIHMIFDSLITSFLQVPIPNSKIPSKTILYWQYLCKCRMTWILLLFFCHCSLWKMAFSFTFD